MGKRSKNARHLKLARQQRTFGPCKAKGRTGAFGGIAADSPLLASASEGSTRESVPPQCYTPSTLLPSKRPWRPPCLPESIREPSKSVTDVLEAKHNAIREFSVKQALGEMSNACADEIASKFGVGRGRNLRYLAKRADCGESLTRKEGSGRCQVRDHATVNQFMSKVAEEQNYVLTFRYLLSRVKEEFGYGSMWLIHQIMQEFEWSKVRCHCPPCRCHG